MIIKLFNEMHVKLGTYMLLYIYTCTSVVKTRPILNNTYNSKMLKQVLFLEIYFDGFSF